MVDEEDRERLAIHRWHLHSDGYAMRSEGPRKARRTVYMHREVLGLAASDPRQVDHINRDKLNNRKANLRVIDRAVQQQNRPSWGATSNHRGVSWDAQRLKWRAHCWVGGRNHYLGRFDSEQAAAEAAADYRRRHMPYATD